LTGLLRKRFFKSADFDYSSTGAELLRLSAAFARQSKMGKKDTWKTGKP
jgi:hypothetical protein